MFLTGFADEASPDLAIQIKATRELGWKYIETRNINGKEIGIPGWDYFWILPSANDSSKIHMAYVSEVYQRADYGKLGL